jgi:hypothetical protein
MPAVARIEPRIEGIPADRRIDGVIDNGVDPRDLLEHGKTDADNHSPSNGREE